VFQGIGLRGLNKGVTATIARNGVFNMVYFGFYHSVKGYLPQYEVCIVQYARCDVCKAAYVCYNCYTIGNCVSKSTFR
jgi:Mitochondrial carrier protein.